MQLIDFSKCKLSGRYYAGSEKKIGIIFNNEPYMLKFTKHTNLGEKRNNVLSEFIGSHIYQLIGIDCQETLLGYYQNEIVVACKDFLPQGCSFTPFNDVGESTIETNKELYQYSYQDIVKLLNSNKKLTNVEEIVSSFFDIYIVDALIGNFDRHGANWGFIKKNNKYSLAPVFDNGSSLFPNMIDEEEMQEVIHDEEKINQRVYDFPTSQIKLAGKKSSYFGVISSLKYKEINQALLRIFPRIDLDEIIAFVDTVPLISQTQKEFYKVMLTSRYQKILAYSYQKLLSK